MRKSLALPLLLVPFAACSQSGDSTQAVTAQSGASASSLDAVAAQLGFSVDELELVQRKKRLSNEDLLVMDKVALGILIDRLKATTGADGAIAQRLAVMQDEFGNVPADAEITAQRQMQALGVVDGIAGGLDSTQWTDAGPGNIGGRVRALVVHPTVTSRLWCGGVAGGIWRSTNSGATWSRVNDLMENLAITTIQFDPNNSNVMYAGTGEGFGNGDAIRGAGIFKSTNGGTAFTRLASTNNSNFHYVNRLALAGSVILAATRSGMWRSTNGGSTWSRTFTTDCRDVKFLPGSTTRAIAHSRTSACGIYTTNGGLSWASCSGLSGGGVRRVEFAWSGAYNGVGAGHCYALKDNGSTLYRSVNGGVSFSTVSTNTMLGSQGWYDNALWVAPFPKNTNAGDDIILAGGIDQWRSTNGGSSFTKISQWFSWPTSAHADHHAITPHPGYNGTTNRTVYFGNDGGVWRANNVLTVSTLSGWTNLNSSLGITQFYGGSRSQTGDVTIGGTQDNGTLRRTSASTYNTWTRPSGGDGGFTASDPTDSRYHYAEYQNGVFRRSTNSGASFSTLRSFSGSLFIAPFILDPNNANRLLYGAGELWRSNNIKAGTPTWTSIHNVSGRVSAITVAKGNSNNIWVGYSNGAVYSTTNGTAVTPTWTRRDTAIPNRFVTRIVIDENNPSTVYVTLGGFSTANVWKTTNGGTTWASLPGLPSAPVRDLEIHPTQRDWLYAATQVGLLVSENNGTTWSSTATPANVTIDEMFWSGTTGDTLYLVTHGRGMFFQKAVSGGASNTSLYYRFDRGVGTSATNYGLNPEPSTMVHGGTPTNGPWVDPGKYGPAMLRGSSNSTASHYNYCDTNWKGPVETSFSVHWWMKERESLGTSLSYVFGGLGTFRCFTNGVAGNTLWLRAFADNTQNLVLPTVGATIQARARAAGGVCVGVSVDGVAKTAQWYVDGVAHGAPIAITGNVGVPVNASSFKIGKHTSNTTSSVYDIDEFRFEHRAATAAEMAAWCGTNRTLYYKFDRGQNDIAINYGTGEGYVQSTMLSAGPGPWQSPGQYGPSMLRGSANNTGTAYNYCDTGWKGPVQGSFTVHWWMKQRNPLGTSLSYLWGGIGSFRCFTNGVAGTNLLVRSWGAADLRFPGNIQALASRVNGVRIGLKVDASNKVAQWYVDGAPSGAPVTIANGANVPVSTSSFKIGKHTSNLSSSAYDIDEFRFDNRAASDAEIASWSAPTAAAGKYSQQCGLDLGSLGGAPTVGNSDYAHTIEFETPTNSPVLFVVGVFVKDPFDMGIAFPALAGCDWYSSFDLQAVVPVNNKLILPGGVPNQASLAGLHVDTQVLRATPAGFNQSNAVSHVIQQN